MKRRARQAARRVAGWLAALATGLALGGARALPSFDEVKAAHRPSDFTLLDRHGTPTQTVRVDPRLRRLAWVALEDMSPALRSAIVLSEDQRFFEHSGIDWSAVLGSAWGNLWNTRTRGASTLTMQLAGLLDEGLARPVGGRGMMQKVEQAVTARQLEARWRKSEILEAYLNAVPWRGELVGINALAQTLFGKFPSGLDLHEAVLAAALLRAPNDRAERVVDRACGVLQRMSLPCTGLTTLAETALLRRGRPALGEQLAPHFARHWIAHAPGNARRSTLDAALQRTALAALRQHLVDLAGRNVEDGAVLVLDSASGDVLAWVGSSGPELSGAAEVDGVLARRQPGSALKPFVYQLAFEKRLITPASLLDDSPTQIGTSDGLYQPQNYDAHFKGWVSARTALGASLNIPAVRVAEMLGPQALHEHLNRLGLALQEGPGHYGHSLALGGAEVSLLALTNAYRSLANGGRWGKPRIAAAAEDATSASGSPAQVGNPAAAFLVTNILADNNARARTFGLASPLASRGFAAVKTGTSKDMRDNWCIGFTDRYTIGVWVGNASGAAMHNVSGISGAAPIWQALVRTLHASRPSTAPAPPAGLITARVAFGSAREAPRDEWFVAGTEPHPAATGSGDARRAGSASAGRAMAAAAPHRAFGIVSPRDGSIFAIDPDIPAQVQRIRFEGEAGRWVLNGKQLGAAARLEWAPRPGRHLLTLLGRDDRPVQTVRFEVRGASLRQGAAER